MLTNEEKTAVKDRLKALFEIIYDEAINNPNFFKRIEYVLLSEEAKLPKEKSSDRIKKPTVNLIEILHNSGDSALRCLLEEKPADDLARICSKDGIKKLKDAKLLPREDLIALIIETTRNRLKQGESFTR